MNQNKGRSYIADPCSENSLVLEFFEPVVDENGNTDYFQCKLCSKTRNGSKKSNLVSHLKCMHISVYTAKVKKKVDGTSHLKLERLKLLQNCVELTTVNKQPFANISSSGFQKIIGEKLDELQKGGCGLNLRSRSLDSVKDHIRKTAARIRAIIGSEIKDRMFSMSADIVTKNNRSIFGLYMQYKVKGLLKTRCVGMKQLHDRHSAKYLCEVLEKCVGEYGATKNNVIALTTDNASNMKSLVTSINKNIGDEMNSDNDDDNSDQQISCDVHVFETQSTTTATSNTIDETDDIEITNLMSRLLPNESDWSFCDHMGNMDWSSMNSLALVNGVNRAAHTIQLAIKNALKEFENFEQANVINMCRDVCKFIRQQTTIYTMKKKGIKPKFPALDVDTRWSSTYLMVRR